MWLTLSIGEWRQHWRLYGWLLIGLVVATALLSGIQVLIGAADEQFSHAQQFGGAGETYRLQSTLPGYQIDYATWAKVRGQGIDAMPVVIGRLQLSDGRWVPVRGITSILTDKANQWQTIVSTKLAAQQDWQIGERPKLKSGEALPPIAFSTEGGGWLLMDIAPAMVLLQSNDKVSFLEISAPNAEQVDWMAQNLPESLQLISDGKRAQQQQPIYDAFMMNLTALGMLSFVVAMFLAYHALMGILNARHKRQQILVTLGASERQLTLWNFTELLGWSLFTGMVGSAAGVYFAKLLSGGFELTLTALYRLDKPLEISWQLGLGLYCSGLIMLGVLVLALLPKIERIPKLAYYALLVTALAVISLLVVSRSQAVALLLCGVTLVVAVFTIPALFRLLIAKLQRLSVANLLWRWAITDLGHYQKGLTTALIAIALALAMAVSTRILVGSFEIALNHHLEQRLFADIYLRGGSDDLKRWQQQLQAHDEITDIKALSERRAELGSRELTIKAIQTRKIPRDVYHFKSADEQWWQQMQAGACLVNEPLALSRQLDVGTKVNYRSGGVVQSCLLVGIYYDYGNPQWELTMTMDVANDLWGPQPIQGLGLTTSMPHEQLTNLLTSMGVPSGAAFWQSSIVSTAKSLFQKTFLITDALASLTLSVALVSWFASLMAQRQRSSSTNSLWQNLGLPPRRLQLARLGQITLLMAITICCALLLGIILGWQLLAVVNPLSFGWSMPVQPLAGSWYLWLLITLVATIAIALLPTAQASAPRGEGE